MIRTVPTGDIGLDLLLGGGWRLVERLEGRESATVVLRGGPGSGKTLLSVDVGLALAGALQGDVVVACVELLPTEYLAQIESGRAELVLQWREGPPVEASRVFVLPRRDPVSRFEVPRIFSGLLADLDTSVPDLVAALEALQSEVIALNGKPAVFIVDSLIGGYGLGAKSPRQNVDALMRFAAQEGMGLVLCEETDSDAPTSWDFAADTVLALEHRSAGDRQIIVRKHRYGASVPGSHELEIGGWRQPRVGPRPDAWLGIRRNAATLRGHGWRFMNAHRYPPLRWIDDFAPGSSDANEYGCSFAVISGPNLEIARKLALGLIPAGVDARRDIVIDLNPLGFDSEGWTSSTVDVHVVSVADGPNFAACDLVEYLGSRLCTGNETEAPRRIVVGDVATVAALPDHAAWAEAISVIAALVTESGWGVPVIAYDSSSVTSDGNEGLAMLRWRAELVVEVTHATGGTLTGRVTSRPDGTFDTIQWSIQTLAGPWPEEIAHLAHLPGPLRRHFSRTAESKGRNRKGR